MFMIIKNSTVCTCFVHDYDTRYNFSLQYYYVEIDNFLIFK